MNKILVTLIVLFIMIPSFHVNAQEKERGRKRHKTQESNTMIDKKAATEIFIDATKARILGDLVNSATLFNRCLELDPGNDAAMYELSQIYFTQGDYSSAATLVEKAIEIDPQNQYYRLLSLEIYGKSGRQDDLLKTCLKLVKQFPGNVDYMFELASAYLMLEKADDAIRTYNEIEGIMGITEEISMQKQRIYMLLDKPDKASAEVEKLLEAFPEQSSRYYSMLAEIYMQANKPDLAAGYYQRIVESEPGNPYVHISLADYYRKKGDTKRSLEELKTGFANPALEVDTKIQVLMAYYSIKEIYDEKKEEVSQLSKIILKAHPSDAKALSLNGDLLFNDKKFSEARDCFRQVLALDSSRYAAWESLLQSEAALSDWSSLAEESTRALDLFPLQPMPYFFNGLALMQLNKPTEAISALNTGAKLVSSNEQLLIQFNTYLGDAYHQTQQYALSDEFYEKVLKVEPDNSYVLNNYSYYLSLRGSNLDKALEMARKGASLDSLNSANLDTYGWVLYKTGNYEEAKVWVGKALVASPSDDPDLLEHYGDILFKLGKPSEALEYWKKALNAGKGSVFLERKVKERQLFE